MFEFVTLVSLLKLEESCIYYCS